MARERNVQLRRTIVSSLIVFSILLTSGIVLIFVNSTSRDALHVEIVRLAGQLESRMLMSWIQIDESVMADSVVDPDALLADLDTLNRLLGQLDTRIQESFPDRASGVKEEFKRSYDEIMAGLVAMEKLIDGSGSGSGPLPGEAISSRFNSFYISYKAYESELPGLLLQDNRRFTYQILAIVFVNLLFLFLAGFVILRLTNRLVRADLEMVRKAVDVETRERERIAADLHDGLGSLLSGLLIHIQALEKKHADDAQLKDQLKQLNYLSNSAISSIEEVINNLHPSSLTRYGLVESVSRLIRRINKLGRTQFRIRVADADLHLQKSTELFLFRICNELINNALKHSNASVANFVFYRDKNRFHLVYSDDGVGFEINELSLEDEKGGLHNMVRRVESMDGKCWIKSKPDQGVEIEIVLDIK